MQTAGKSLEAEDKIFAGGLKQGWRERHQKDQHEHSLYMFTLQKSGNNKENKLYCTPDLLYFRSP